MLRRTCSPGVLVMLASSGEQALGLARKRGERGSEAWSLRVLGEIAAKTGTPDVEHAEACYRAALALATERGIRFLAALCHLGLARIYRQTRNPATWHTSGSPCRWESRLFAKDGNIRVTALVFHRDGRPVGDFKKAWATACKAAGACLTNSFTTYVAPLPGTWCARASQSVSQWPSPAT